MKLNRNAYNEIILILIDFYIKLYRGLLLCVRIRQQYKKSITLNSNKDIFNK